MQEKEKSSEPIRTSSTEEVSEPIPEEEEQHGEEDPDDKPKTPEKNNSDPSLPSTPVLESNSLQSDGTMFREVTVTGGE